MWETLWQLDVISRLIFFLAAFADIFGTRMDADFPPLPPNNKKTPTSHSLISRKTLRVNGPSRDAKAKVIHVPLCSH